MTFLKVSQSISAVGKIKNVGALYQRYKSSRKGLLGYLKHQIPLSFCSSSIIWRRLLFNPIIARFGLFDFNLAFQPVRIIFYKIMCITK